MKTSPGDLGEARATSPWLWHGADAKTRLLGTALVALGAAVLGLAVAAQLEGVIYGDYFVMWSFARFALTHPVSLIYDPEALHAFQLTYKPDLGGYFPFPYPPTYLLPLLPFGALPLAVGWVAWSASGLGAYLVAVLARAWRAPELLLVVLAPATLLSLTSGQNGLFAAALMVGGVRLMGARPVLAGVLFGLMTFKPQLGLLLPVALAAAGMWRCFAAAAATSVMFAAAATAAFGASIWAVWLAALRTHYGVYVVTGNLTRPRMPTISASLKLVGVADGVADLVQFASAVAVAVLVWVCMRRRGPDALAVAALLVGTFLATPYALFYDLPPVTFALLILARHALARGGALGTAELLVMLFAYLVPLGEFATGVFPVPLKAPALLLLFGVIVRRALARPGRLA